MKGNIFKQKTNQKGIKSMKKLISLLLVIIIIITCSLLSGCNWDNIFQFQSTTNEKTIIIPSNQETDFVPGHVLVLLDKNISEPNKVHSKEFFLGVSIEEIIDLTQRENPIDQEEFQQILLLILVDKTKKAVVEACEILEQIDGIESADPDYYVYPEEASNDPYYSFSDGTNDQWSLEK